jgi:hypothetical protein
MAKCGMEENGRDGVAVGPVVSEGGRSPSTLSPGQCAPLGGGGTTLGPLAPGQRWSAGRKREVVLRLMRGESAELLSRELGLPVFRLEQWRQRAEAALEGALKGLGHCPRPRRTRLMANSPPPCGASASSAWRTSCCAPGSSDPALWSAGGRGDGGGDLPGHRPPLRRRARLPGLGGGQVLVLRRPPGGGSPRVCREPGRHAAGRSRPSPTRICWRRSGPTSRARPGPARGTARSGPGCGRWTASGSRASGCCG